MAVREPPGHPPGRGRGRQSGQGPARRGAEGKPMSVAQRHAEWVGLLRPDGPFIAVPVLAEAFPQGLDMVPDDTLDKLGLAWAEVREAPDLLTPAWEEFVLGELLGYTPQILSEGGALPADLRAGLPSGGRLRPDGIAYGPDGQGGRAERLLIYRLPHETPLTAAARDQPSAAEQAAELCRYRGTPFGLLTNGALWALVHARPGEPATTAVFDADIWLEERDLLRAFASLLGARQVMPPATQPDGTHSFSLAALFARSAEAQAEITTTLGTQVLRAVELLVGELSRLDRESGGTLLGDVAPRAVYRGALTVMMRLVFLLYVEEQRLLPVSSELYATAYSVTGLHDQLDAERSLYGDEVGDRRTAAWPRLLATFTAVYAGSEYDEMRIPPYGGGLFDPARYPWLEGLAVTDRVVHEVLGALLILRRRGGAAERLSYKGLDVEQIGHVYEGLLEFSCLRVDEPYLGLIGKLEPELPLTEVEEAAEDIDSFFDWLAAACGTTVTAVRKAMGTAPRDEPALHAACDNDEALTDRVRPLRGLLRRDLRGLPVVFPAGSLVVTQVGDRRGTGTYYTPRKLAEEIIEYTLAPLCYSPGPTDGAEPADWRVRPAAELLGLKVLDPAMGSGAFLVSACRYLAERLVEAWERDEYPDPVLTALGPTFDRDDAALEARRRVAARCLYGVDRDEAAVELGKLSLWLITLAKDQPFSFLDHALRCGDSLIGLISESQVEAFHLDPNTGRRINARLTGAIDEVAGPILTRVRDLREEIEAEPVRDPHQADVLTKKLQEAERLTARLRGLADVVAASALSTASQPEDAFNDRLTSVEGEVQRLLTARTADSPLEQAFRAKLGTWLQGPRPEPIQPLHWALAFPETMRRGGFDAVVSNPPFMGGTTISGRIGKDFLSYLGRFIADGHTAGGRADLCSFFLLRYLAVARNGRVGIIATNTIAQGDTREVGLDRAFDMGWSVYRADKSQRWPGTASLEVSLLWVGHPGDRERRILDEHGVRAITSSLNPPSRISGNPHSLVAGSGRSFEGCKPLGMGFILEPEEAQALIKRDPRNKEVLFPYLNGEDLNSRPDCSARRWAINFHDWPIDKAMQYEDVFAIVAERVRPERQRKLPDGRYVLRKPLPDRWWQYAEKRLAMRRAISNFDRILVIARISRTGKPAFVPRDQVLNEKLIVFATGRAAMLSLLSSSIHSDWAWRFSSTLKTDLQYTPSDCFETFPEPHLTERMDVVGEDLDVFRRGVLERRAVGLTSLYDLIHSEPVRDEDIVRLREIHIEIDQAVREAYALDEEREPAILTYETRVASTELPSWRQMELGHGFHQTPQGVRFTISPQAREDVLDKLLALNHYRYQQEVQQGLHSKKGRGASRKEGGRRTTSDTAPILDDGGLFPPGGALF
jgi:hypothetical protein